MFGYLLARRRRQRPDYAFGYAGVSREVGDMHSLLGLASRAEDRSWSRAGSVD